MGWRHGGGGVVVVEVVVIGRKKNESVLKECYTCNVYAGSVVGVSGSGSQWCSWQWQGDEHLKLS